MVVEQEDADLYPLTAGNVQEYLPEIECRDCGYASRLAFVESLLAKEANVEQ